MVANEPTADEHALRRCICELTALSTLSAVWSRSDVQEVADGLAVVLFRALPVAIVYVQAYGMDGTAVEVVHTPQGLVSTEQASEIGKALGASQKPCGSEATPTIANPVGDGMVRLVIIPLG